MNDMKVVSYLESKHPIEGGGWLQSPSGEVDSSHWLPGCQLRW